MNTSELAKLMLAWEQAQQLVDALRIEIEDAVLEIGKTQTVGNVRATYSAGRRTFDYEAAVKGALSAGWLEPDSLAIWESEQVDWFEVVQGAIQDGKLDGSYLDAYTKTVIDYAAAAKALELDAPVIAQKPASVTVKLLA